MQLALQVFNGDRHHSAEHLGFKALAGFAAVLARRVFVRAALVEVVRSMAAVQVALAAQQVAGVQAAVLQFGDGAPQLFRTPLQRTQQRPGGTGQAPLKDAQGQPCRALVAKNAAVDVAQIGAGGVVQRLLPFRTGA